MTSMSRSSRTEPTRSCWLGRRPKILWCVVSVAAGPDKASLRRPPLSGGGSQAEQAHPAMHVAGGDRRRAEATVRRVEPDNRSNRHNRSNRYGSCASRSSRTAPAGSTCPSWPDRRRAVRNIVQQARPRRRTGFIRTTTVALDLATTAGAAIRAGPRRAGPSNRPAARRPSP